MKKDHNGTIGFLIIIAFAMIVAGIFFILYYERYILLILGILFAIITIVLNQKCEKDKTKKFTKEDIRAMNGGKPHDAKSIYKDIFTALYDSNNKMIAQDIQMPDTDFFLYGGHQPGTYYYKTIGMDKRGKWITLMSQTIIYEYAKPIKIISEQS